MQQNRFQHEFGPWAFTTGASSGIGRAFAEHAAARGLHVALSARRPNELEQVAASIRNANGVETRILPFDLGSSGGPGAALRAVQDIDIGLYVGAAGFASSGPFVDANVDNESNMIDVNCRALMIQTHALATRLAARKRGGIILLSSIVAFQGAPFSSNYAATKAYVQSLAEGLRHELAPHGVKVCACAPGPVATGFAARAGMTMKSSERPEAVAAETLRRLGRCGVVRPGHLAKFLGMSLATLPRWARVRVMSKIMAGMTTKDA